MTRDSRMTKVETDVNQILMMVSNLQKTIELARAQSEALDETWGNSITPQHMYGARNLSGSFSAAGKPPLSPRAAVSPRPDIMMAQEQNCFEIRSIVSELRLEKKRAEEQRMHLKITRLMREANLLGRQMTHLE